MLSLLATTFVLAFSAVFPSSVFNQSAMAQASASTASDPFVGKWKLDPNRSQASDEMKVADAGENSYTLDLGADTRETIVLDGTDRPAAFNSTLAVSSEGPNSWKVVRKLSGRVALTAIWELSPDGNTLTDHFTSFQPNGATNHVDYVYKRTAGSSGFAGTWEDTSKPPSFELLVQPYDGDGLSFINNTQKTTKSVKFDGKDYPVKGANVLAGFVTSGHRVNEQTLQLAEKIADKPLNTQQVELSLDLKTLTMTIHPQGVSKARILVFDRE